MPLCALYSLVGIGREMHCCCVWLFRVTFAILLTRVLYRVTFSILLTRVLYATYCEAIIERRLRLAFLCILFYGNSDALFSSNGIFISLIDNCHPYSCMQQQTNIVLHDVTFFSLFCFGIIQSTCVKFVAIKINGVSCCDPRVVISFPGISKFV